MKVDYEVLEPITDPFQALEPGAPLVHSPDTFSPRPSNLLQPVTAYARGDVDAALKTAVHVVEGTWRTQAIDPAFLEPEACLVLPQGRGVVVHTDSQGSIYDRQQIAKVLNVPPGGRGNRSSPPAAALLARKKSCRSRPTRLSPRTCWAGRSRRF